MCQSSAYMEKDGENELIMEDVESFEASKGQIRLVNMFGEEKKLDARIIKLYLVEHKILLEQL